MRIEPGEGRGAAAGRTETTGREGGFAGALGRAARPFGRERPAGDAASPAPATGTVGDILSGLASPVISDSMSRAAGAPLLARAVERVVLLVKSGEAATVTMQLGPSLQVTIAQARAGVEVQIRAPHGLSPMAEAELPVLVAALRARGIRVAGARVAPRSRQGRRSLTPRRSSATRAGDDGSVAKW